MMNARNNFTHSSQSDLDNLVALWTPKIFIFSLLLILFSTLFPFDFYFSNGFFITDIVESFSNTSDLSDQIGNILLFMPLGFGLSGLLPTKRLGATGKFAIVLIISASLSSTVEVLQAFLPLRASTISDIVTNTTGGGLGFLCFHVWRYTIISYALTLTEKSKKSLSSKKLTAGFIGYIVLLCFISVALPGTMNLRNWDTTFPLLLGNEKTGNRPWQGSVSGLHIADRAISQQEIVRAFSDKRSFASIGDSLVASYQLTDQGGYHDRSGHLPDLVWRGQPPTAQDENGVFLSSSHWLETVTPVTSLSQRIQKTSQFTLNVTVRTAKTTQAGPARIVSLSSDTNHRNFTLGQDKSDLVFRLRTPISGENGTNPDIVVPGLFSDSGFHHIIITYNGLFLNIYIDKLENLHSFELAPMSYRVLYYELIFIPLGLLLALLFNVYKGRFIFYIFLLCGGILVPSLIVEGILATGSSRSFSLANLLTSLSVTVATLLVFTLPTPYRLNKKSVQ